MNSEKSKTSPKPCCDANAKINKLLEQVIEARYGTKNRAELILKLEDLSTIHSCHQAKPEDNPFSLAHGSLNVKNASTCPPEVSPEEFIDVREISECCGATTQWNDTLKENRCYKCDNVCQTKIKKIYPPEVSPEKKCKKCGVVDSSGLTPRTNSAMCNPHEWVDFSPAKEEKECGKDKCQMAGNCPTLTEQKVEWEEEFCEEFCLFPKKHPKSIECGLDDEAVSAYRLKSFIAAKKKIWEAQKEQAVKAEIQKEILEAVKWTKDIQSLSARLFLIVNSLLSDKVNHYEKGTV